MLEGDGEDLEWEGFYGQAGIALLGSAQSYPTEHFGDICAIGGQWERSKKETWPFSASEATLAISTTYHRRVRPHYQPDHLPVQKSSARDP